jgi:hypothetical protein
MDLGSETRAREKRASPRFPYITEVHCDGPGAWRADARTADLSALGAFIDVADPAPQGARVALHFHIGDALVKTEADVARRLPEIGMGVRFVSLRPVWRIALASMEARINGRAGATLLRGGPESPIALPAPAAYAVPHATVTLRSTPPGAFLMVDNRPIGRVPARMRIAPGIRTLRLELSGYEPWQREFTLKAGGTMVVEVKLRSQ